MLKGGAEGMIQERQGVRAVTPAGATGVTDRWQRPGGLYWEGSGEDQGDADADAQIQSWRAEGKLFHAQQGLLRLRAAFEDVGNREMWDRLTDQYESLADTMQMMRRYRFEDYHQRYLEFHLYYECSVSQ